MRETIYYQRMRAIPREIVDRSLRDAVIHMAIEQYAHADEDIGIETFLVKLVLLLSDSNAQTTARFTEYVERSPAPLVIIRGA
jgi:hypothetical protein